MRLTIRADGETPSERAQRLEQVGQLAAGQRVVATVEAVLPAEGLRVRLRDYPTVSSTIAPAQLSDHSRLCNQLLSTYKVGDEVEPLVVFVEGARPVLTLKPLLLRAAAEDEHLQRLPKALAEVQVHSQHVGYIRSIASFGLFVQLLHGVVGVTETHHADKRRMESLDKFFAVGQTVQVSVLSVDVAASRLRLSMTAAATAASATSEVANQTFISSYFADLQRLTQNVSSAMAQLAVGDKVTARIEGQKKLGLNAKLVLEDSAKKAACAAFITTEQALGVICKVGQEVEARILDVDRVRNVVDLSIRPEMVQHAGLDRQLAEAGSATAENGHATKKAAGGSGSESAKRGKKKADGSKSEASSSVTALPALASGTTVDATVELAKEDYVIVSLPGGALACAPAHGYNDQLMPRQTYTPGRRGRAVIFQRAPADQRLLCAFQTFSATAETVKAAKAAVKEVSSREYFPTVHFLRPSAFCLTRSLHLALFFPPSLFSCVRSLSQLLCVNTRFSLHFSRFFRLFFFSPRAPHLHRAWQNKTVKWPSTRWARCWTLPSSACCQRS